jgi:hypothetical protein
MRTLVIWFVLCACSLASDKAKLPIDSIPRLPESYELEDYHLQAASGTILPDRIVRDSLLLKVGQSEEKLSPLLADSSVTCPAPVHRTREEQWQLIREILARCNQSANYYTLVDPYYEQQLEGWFKTYRWPIPGLGQVLVHLHAEREQSPYRIWLLELRNDPVPKDSVGYLKGKGMTMLRKGTPSLEWDLSRNWVRILGR